MIRQCGRCSWTFERTHSDKCPQCGCSTHGHDEIHQGSWLSRQIRIATERLELEAELVQCCYTAKHSRGVHHDPSCPEQPECY